MKRFAPAPAEWPVKASSYVNIHVTCYQRGEISSQIQSSMYIFFRMGETFITVMEFSRG